MRGNGDEVSKALGKAFSLLAVRSCSEAEMRSRLLRAGYSEGVVADALVRLKDYGYVDDARFSREKACALRDRGFGKSRIAHELKVRGVEPGLIGEAIGDAFGETGEEEIAYRLVVRRLPGYQRLPDPVKKRRLYGLLIRRGFSGGLASRMIKKILGD